ncbi:2OG-Fe(II) oxygenase family protein [Caulobacter soli]|uniref:2OG-Fe(II) oxygenase family protein n=1 Tax=Caulobacter soli TaxID=2708539 RepID=UPI0013ED1391|nr:putative 2OG-Fe(II) oxygenase [Caulobacter soli]
MAPDTAPIVQARDLRRRGLAEQAEAVLRAAVRRQPDHLEAHRDLVQLIWTRTSDAGQAMAELDAAVEALPHALGLRVTRARLLGAVGRSDLSHTAYEALCATPAGGDPRVLMEASRAAVAHDPATAVAHARRAAAALPGDLRAACVLAEALLANGQAEQAAPVIEDVLAKVPDDQGVLALAATAWRLTGDPRYWALYDYDAFVGGGPIAVPPGWNDLPSYLRDLVAALDRLHARETDPIGQSVRLGTQTRHDLLRDPDPAIQAFFRAVDAPIRAYLDGLGQGEDPVRRRKRSGYRIVGAWSVNLRPGGFHIDHIHAEGWLSSACHIEASVGDEDHAGWLRFGQPGLPTQPRLEAERFQRPEPGRLVLFPSYMWHGTAPFMTGPRRLTIAFDLVPSA